MPGLKTPQHKQQLFKNLLKTSLNVNSLNFNHIVGKKIGRGEL